MSTLSPELIRKLRRRRTLVLLVLVAVFGVLIWRAYVLQIEGRAHVVQINKQKEWELKVREISKTDAARERKISVYAERGSIIDRNGELLSVSAPVISIAANPQKALCSLKFMRLLTNLPAQKLLDKDQYAARLQTWSANKGKLTIASNVSSELALAALSCPLLGSLRVQANLGTPENSKVLRSKKALQEFLKVHQGADMQIYSLKPSKLAENIDKQLQGLVTMAAVLRISKAELLTELGENKQRSFKYIKRHMPPSDGLKIAALKLEGVYSEREYRRYYPSAEVAGHLIGFTNVYASKNLAADQGQAGLELTFNKWLAGTAGTKKVVVDGFGRIIQEVEWVQKPKPGNTLQLSLDMRLQYIAYRALKEAVLQHRAEAGSAVVLDAQTGEVLALVNQPAFNPNNRSAIDVDDYRNRAVLDSFEPGSTMKPFTIAAALEYGLVNDKTLIDTNPGVWQVLKNTVKDVRNYGLLSLAGIIKHSSNVGAAKVASKLTPEQQWQMYARLGFGSVTASGFAAETQGILHPYEKWSPFDRATMGFGYGLSVSTLQLAQAYAALANDGVRVPISFLLGGSQLPPVRVFSAGNAKKVRRMMQAVVSSEGTAPLAQVSGYTIAGKTGTAHKARAGGYEESRYASVFAGIAPAVNPRLVMVVMIDDSRGDYYGGQVAAPVFGKVMRQALRLMNIAPDDLPNKKILYAKRAGGNA